MAVSSEVEVANLALNAVGERSNISALAENSRPAEVCNLWYSVVRDQILTAAFWPEATKIAYPALIAEQDDDVWLETEPRTGYQFVYGMPSDALRPRYMDNFTPFLYTSYGDNQRVLHSNYESAVLVYTRRLETVSLWDAELQMAIIYGLAANICMPLSGKPVRAKSLADKANELIMNARVGAANSNNEQHETMPDWITARGYNVPGNQRFIYPYSSLLSVMSI